MYLHVTLWKTDLRGQSKKNDGSRCIIIVKCSCRALRQCGLGCYGVPNEGPNTLKSVEEMFSLEVIESSSGPSSNPG